MFENGGIVWVMAGMGLLAGGSFIVWMGYLLACKIGVVEDKWWEF